jgi:predicted transposase/invertase (TIGR01784 family)
MERFDPLNDYLFLKFMGEEGCEEQCLAFLNAVFADSNARPVRLVKILENKTFTAEIVGDKTSILDVRVETDAGEKINIEVQRRDLHNMEQRTLLHWGREYTKSISAGEDYALLPKVVTINIVNFDNIKLERFHTSFHLWEDGQKDYLLTDVLEIHFINMVKFRRLAEKDIRKNLLERWMTFFDKTTPDETIQEVINMDAAIKKAYDQIDFVTRDKEFLRQYHLREMAMSDWTTGINTAMEKGIAQGLQQGIEKGIKKGKSQRSVEIAKNLLALGIPVNQIAQATGLTEQDICG